MKIRALVLLIVFLPLASLLTRDLGASYPSAHGQTSPMSRLEVVSPGYGGNITDLNIGPGSIFKVDVNLTNAGPISAFDITLDYAISPMLKTILSTSTSSVTLSPGLFDGAGLPSGCSARLLTIRVVPDPFDTVRVAALLQGGCTVNGNGRLFSVTFNVIDTGATSLHIEQAANGRLQFLVVGPPPNFGNFPDLQVVDAYFRNKPGIPPVAKFSFTPNAPVLGDTVSFDATQSYDPDNATLLGRGIRNYLWVFGDNSPPSLGSQVFHVFSFTPTVPAAGTFEVRLVIIDTDDGIPVQQSTIVHILQPAVHDAAASISLDRIQINASTPIQITVTVYNRGNRDENITLNVSFDYRGQTPIANPPQFLLPQNSSPRSFTFTLQTTNLPPSLYTITASVQLVNAIDVNPSDNMASVSFTVLPNVGKLDVTVDTGSIYFPGDSVVIYLLSQFNGAPVSPDSIQLTLIKPDGSNTSLQATSLSIGLSRATYPISNIGPFGTYAIVARGQKSGFTPGTSLVTFEVKPSWLSRNGPGIMQALGAVVLSAAIAVAWQRGYLRKKDQE